MTVPYEHGLLDVGDGQHIYWECCGNSAGTPVLMVHGGPGSGCSPAMRNIVNLGRHRLILFDQRGCGRSRPHAADPTTDLTPTTPTTSSPTWNGFAATSGWGAGS